MFFATLSKASLAILVASLILVLTSQTEAHSYADCIDWKFDPKAKNLSWKKGHCEGYARRFPATKKIPFAKLDSDDPNRHYQQSHKSTNSNKELACSDGKQGEEPGADETMGKPISSAYSGKYGKQTFSYPGGQLCVRWPAKNHAVAGEKSSGAVKIALSKVNVTKDPTQAEFNNRVIKELDYKGCTDKGSDEDIWPCGGCFNLPTNLTAGNYVMQWRWKLNSNEWYTSCADINVKPKAK
ncbi:hypothetical protein BGX24_011087 [Mortierella sp. AD032]|nr:hypothetical protein BGX24_011087 [Mortierella sp. AD032]